MSAVLAALRRTATSLRLARRDLRRRPGSVALVVAMVSLPVAIVMAVGVVNASGKPTHAELVASELGMNEAWVMGVAPAGTQVFPSSTNPHEYTTADTDDLGDGDPAARDPRGLLPQGAQVIPIAGLSAIVSTDAAAARLPVTLGPLWKQVFAGRASIVEGDTPEASDEVMVSPGLVDRFGLRLGDSLTVGDGHRVRVVGVLAQARSWDDGAVYGTADLDLGDTPPSTTWYLSGAALTADDVAALTSDGFLVFTRDGIREVTGADDGDSAGAAAAMALGGGLGLVEVVLLAGAAFAVGMRRRQHDLALLAATGARRGELVGVGLASGAWHGLAAGLVGVPLGLAAAWAILAAQVRWGGAEGSAAVWGYHVVWWHVAVAMAFGLVAALLASLIPAIGSSGVDVMAALRGSQRPRTFKALPAYVGGALVAVSAAMFVVAARLTDAVLDYPAGEGGSAQFSGTLAQLAAVILAFVGVLMALPRLLGWLSGVGSWFGVAARIAARDAARNPGRTVPVIAAIAVTVTLGATTFLHEVRYEQDFGDGTALQNPLGSGVVYLTQWGDGETPTFLDPAVVEQGIREAIPGADVSVLNMWQDPWNGAEGPFHAVTVPSQNVCIENRMNADGSMPVVTRRQIASDPNCRDALGTDVYQVVAGDATALAALLGHEPSSAAVDALANGGIVSFDPRLLVDGKATVAEWDGGDSRTDAFELDAVTEAPVNPFFLASAVVSPQTAAAHGIVTQPTTLLVTKPGGLTEADADAANLILARYDTNLVVQGEMFEYADIIAGISLAVVGLIALFATGLALGLARAEARRDDFTLASLGASPALAKRTAGWQAALSVFVALAIGFGVALALDWARSHEYYGSTFAPPWWQFAVALIALPALVGVVCGLATRAPKAVHYRLAA